MYQASCAEVSTKLERSDAEDDGQSLERTSWTRPETR